MKIDPFWASIGYAIVVTSGIYLIGMWNEHRWRRERDADEAKNHSAE